MSADPEYELLKQKVINYLNSLEGKKVDTISNIAIATGIKRRDLSRVINQMELEGMVQPAGVTAGVIGYKLIK
jgi:DNA-binding MarR family transcriptional regulator